MEEQNSRAQASSVDQTTFDRDQLLHHPLLPRKLANLHRVGSYLRSACPKCGGKDRFFTGPAVGYRVWHCHHCSHTEFTVLLLGQAWTTAPRPAVQPWIDSVGPAPATIAAIREVYASLATHAASAFLTTPHAIEYLERRGLPLAQAQAAGLGYLDTSHYRQWYTDVLTPIQRAIIERAGLPEGRDSRLTGHGSMFAGGHQGKIVFPYFNLAGDVVDIRTRSISPKDTINGEPVRYTSPKHPFAQRGVDTPYGLPFVGDARRVLLTEGEFKALIPHYRAGVPVMALRGVSDFIPEYLPYLRQRLVILAFDNDDPRAEARLTAGQTAAIRIGRQLEAHDVDVMVLDPTRLLKAKGLDDFVNVYSPEAMRQLIEPAYLVTLAEFEAKLQRAGGSLSSLKHYKADPGVKRQWTPPDHIDAFAHLEQATITVDQAVAEISGAVDQHLCTWRKGRPQLLITAPAGVGKTQTTLETTLSYVGETGQTVAVFLPNHATIEEKINDGTLAGFQHIYGHNAENCKQHEKAQILHRYGYSPGVIICPDCPFRSWCNQEGYRSQFRGKANRTYVHQHMFSDYPEGEDIAIADELTHKLFVEEMTVWPGDVINALQSAKIEGAQRKLLDALIEIFKAPDLVDLERATFYEVLWRFYPDLRNVDAWGDGSLVQGALDSLAGDFMGNVYQAEQLPQQFGEKLFAVLAEDVRRLNAGQPPTGRVRLVVMGGGRKLVLTYSRGRLPAWYSQHPTIILNATADAAITNDLIGPINVLAPQVEVMAGNEIVQDVTLNNAKSAYTGDSADATQRRDAWLKRIRQHIDQHLEGEADTTIIVAKALAGSVQESFPNARVAYYHALEGRNDLQSGLTILASAPPVNLEAVKREAQALYPGMDTTLIRSRIAFDQTNAGGEYLAVEQIDGADPKLQALIWQHRDAAAIQAVHRSRIIRQPGRKVVVMFSRPIPGLKPTRIISDRPGNVRSANERKQQTIERLITATQGLLDELGGVTLSRLAERAGAAKKTVLTYWSEITSALDLQWFDLPVIQSLANGAQRSVTMRFAFPRATVEKAKMHVVSKRYQNLLIALGNDVQLLLPDGWRLDYQTLQKMVVETSPPEPAQTKPESPTDWALLLFGESIPTQRGQARGSAAAIGANKEGSDDG